MIYILAVMIILSKTFSQPTELDKEITQYLASSLPPYNSVYFAGVEYTMILKSISEIDWKDKDQFKILAVSYANTLIKSSACLDGVYFKRKKFSYENRELLRDIKTTLKAFVFNSGEKYKRLVKFNKLVSGQVYDIPVVTEKNIDNIISKYCSKEVKNYLKNE